MSESLADRKNERHLHETSIMFTCGTDHPYCFYGARMYNHSIGGIYFESKYALEPGEIICFNQANYSLEDYRPDDYKTYRVEVKWCKEISIEEGWSYGIGVEYVDPLPSQMRSDRPSVDHTDSEMTPDGRLGDIPDDKDMTQTERMLKQAVDTAEEKANELLTLNRFVTSVGTTLDLDEILQSICKEMTVVFGARNTGIGLLDRKRTKITIASFYAADPDESDVTGLSVPLKGNAATHRVVETGQPIVVPDVQNNPLTSSMHDLARRRGTECLMIVPLMTRGEVIGTIGMPTSDKDRVFSTEDVSLAQTLASQIASAIENARLYAKTEKAKEIAEHDLEIGRKIQTDFFPERLPELTGWEFAAHFQPASQVSGDFYDFLLFGQGQKVGLGIADVCDHGVGSALFMVLFRSLIRAFSYQNFVPQGEHEAPAENLIVEAMQRTITSTNNYIANVHSKSGMFATVFFGVLDSQNGYLYYINGGHEAPVIIDKDGKRTPLKFTGPAVGMFADLEFSVEQIELNPADTLFAYTDGVTDVQNPDGEGFTKDRLLDMLSLPTNSAREMIDNLAKEIESHISDADQNDDLTMIAIRRQ
ncbi:GAF domain-containing SpoIIE family protein phosphatase [Thermodesulfobacteriota bacterium]